MNNERDEPRLLDYESPIPRGSRRRSGWLRRLNSGEDTFLASSALLFALLCWAISGFGWALGAPGLSFCASVALLAISFVLALASFFEEARTSRTFAVISLMLCAGYVVALAALR
ncbi:MAG TPA: hypothetical protein VH475_08325 [Tepidisphaeraceae bacterium]